MIHIFPIGYELSGYETAGTKRYPLHKAILMAAFDVFEAMVPFDAQNAKSAAGKETKPVEVPDVKVGAFKAMLAFIYAYDLSGLNGDNALAMQQQLVRNSPVFDGVLAEI
ncbi:hypothetical protein GPALN_002091 [Globodera pallida]|nr:hypothetical protein GPALN_002091 [Globodera pallida]